eukprot:1141186-Pelagomonas_calceolata.AAC.1
MGCPVGHTDYGQALRLSKDVEAALDGCNGHLHQFHPDWQKWPPASAISTTSISSAMAFIGTPRSMNPAAMATCITCLCSFKQHYTVAARHSSALKAPRGAAYTEIVCGTAGEQHRHPNHMQMHTQWLLRDLQASSPHQKQMHTHQAPTSYADAYPVVISGSAGEQPTSKANAHPVVISGSAGEQPTSKADAHSVVISGSAGEQPTSKANAHP